MNIQEGDYIKATLEDDPKVTVGGKMSERTPIKPEDIRKGDLIRIEVGPPRNYRAIEFQATQDRDRHWFEEDGGVFYLLNRPGPPFEPYWGMVITGNPLSGHRAIYSPSYEYDSTPWVSTSYEGVRDEDWDWCSNEWAEQKLAEGWTILEKPEWAP